MATTKKKPATTHKPITKSTPKVAATTAARKSTAKKRTQVEAQSFRPCKESTPFMTFSFTQQSLYWLILSVLVLALGAWVMYLNVKIQNIYDQVEMNTQLNEAYMKPATKKSAPEAAPAAQ